MAVIAACAMVVGCQSTAIQATDQGPTLVDLSGIARQPLHDQTHSITVLLFITNDCPIANGYAPEINSIVKEYSDQSAAFYLVHVDSDLSAEQARKHADDYGFKCPVLLDPKHELVHAVGATVTPEAAVVLNRIDGDEDRLAYRGRIDDRQVDLGKRRINPSRRDLREAIEAALQGRPAPHPRTKAVGCFIAEPPK